MAMYYVRRYKNRCGRNVDMEKDGTHQLDGKDNEREGPEEGGREKNHG